MVSFEVAVMLLPRFYWLRTSCSSGFGTCNVEFLDFVTWKYLAEVRYFHFKPRNLL